MQIDTLVLGALQTNCYLLSNELSGEAFIIDPADEGDFLNEELLRRGLRLTAIVLTHGHFDHCLGLLSLQTAWNVPIMMDFADQFLLARAQASARHWLHMEVDPVPPATVNLEKGVTNLDGMLDNTQLTLIDEQFQLIHTPGHTPGSICLLHTSSQTLFSGDTIFANGDIGRTDFAYSDRKKMKASLAYLKGLHKQGLYNQVYAGHGVHHFIY